MAIGFLKMTNSRMIYIVAVASSHIQKKWIILEPVQCIQIYVTANDIDIHDTNTSRITVVEKYEYHSHNEKIQSRIRIGMNRTQYNRNFCFNTCQKQKKHMNIFTHSAERTQCEIREDAWQ